MALERNPACREPVVYTCPMHPEIRRDSPGECPICGMALEPETISAKGAEDNSELIDMSRRFWVGAALAVVSAFAPDATLVITAFGSPSVLSATETRGHGLCQRGTSISG